MLLLGLKNVVLLGLHSPIAPNLHSHMLPEWKSRGNLTSRVNLLIAEASRKWLSPDLFNFCLLFASTLPALGGAIKIIPIIKINICIGVMLKMSMDEYIWPIGQVPELYSTM